MKKFFQITVATLGIAALSSVLLTDSAKADDVVQMPDEHIAITQMPVMHVEPTQMPVLH